ncbi:MAG: hypothetical protein ACOYVK_06100 [Bacillota bacterium]
MQNQEMKCPKCNASLKDSFRKSYASLLEGYIFCDRCNTRLNIKRKDTSPEKKRHGSDSYEEMLYVNALRTLMKKEK